MCHNIFKLQMNDHFKNIALKVGLELELMVSIVSEHRSPPKKIARPNKA